MCLPGKTPSAPSVCHLIQPRSGDYDHTQTVVAFLTQLTMEQPWCMIDERRPTSLQTVHKPVSFADQLIRKCL